jgi:hypothetical protein
MMSPDQLYDPAALASIGSRDNVGGPRGYKGAEIAARAPWRCPSCGFENVSRELGQGCESCHAGEGAAKHVGIDPIVRPKAKPVRTLADPILRPTDVSGDLSQAFLAWMQKAGTEIGPLAAFTAGWESARMTSPVTPKEQTDDSHNADPLARGDMVGGDLPGAVHPGSMQEGDQADPGDSSGAGAAADLPPADPESPEGFVGTAQERTLLAALIFFREQVMAQGPEEVVSGEWMTPEELDRWIAELKGPYA